MISYNWDYLDINAYFNRAGQYKTKRQYQFIIETEVKMFDKILDIAGGSGRFALPLCAYSDNITVVDLNPHALQLLKERDSSINTINIDFRKFFTTDTFSLLLCIEGIGYFENWEEFFNKVNSLLMKDGRFIFSYTNPKSWRFLLRKIRHWKNGHYPYKEMEMDELLTLLKRCNLEIDRMEGMNWIPLSVTSNSIFVSFFEFIEKIFKLKNWHSQSPWLLISVKKHEMS